MPYFFLSVCLFRVVIRNVKDAQSELSRQLNWIVLAKHLQCTFLWGVEGHAPHFLARQWCYNQLNLLLFCFEQNSQGSQQVSASDRLLMTILLPVHLSANNVSLLFIYLLIIDCLLVSLSVYILWLLISQPHSLSVFYCLYVGSQKILITALDLTQSSYFSNNTYFPRMMLRIIQE